MFFCDLPGLILASARVFLDRRRVWRLAEAKNAYFPSAGHFGFLHPPQAKSFPKAKSVLARNASPRNAFFFAVLATSRRSTRFGPISFPVFENRAGED